MQDSPSEATIQRDINRTFPAHDYFRESGGVGQDALFKISKAYAVYDEEIGYCQGFSFLAAALVLHVRIAHVNVLHVLVGVHVHNSSRKPTYKLMYTQMCHGIQCREVIQSS